MEDDIQMIQRAGTCRYCHQQRFVEVPEDADEEEINETATEECAVRKHFRKRNGSRK